MLSYQRIIFDQPDGDWIKLCQNHIRSEPIFNRSEVSINPVQALQGRVQVVVEIGFSNIS